MNLGVLLNYRTQVEEALRTELSRMQGVLYEAEALVAELERVAERETSQYLRDVAQGLGAEEVVGRQGELAALADRIRQAKMTVETHRQRCGEKLEDVLAAAQERRKLELVEERQRHRAAVDATRAEQRELDELAAQRYLAEHRPQATSGQGGERHED